MHYRAGERPGDPVHGLDAGIQELIKGFTMIKNTRFGNV